MVDAGGSLDLVFATSSVDFGLTDDDAGQPGYLTIGFDLDLTCTGEGQGPSCVEPAGSGPHVDGVDGIDNASGEVLYTLNKSSVGPQAVPSTSTATLIIRVQGYDGESDDDQVTASLYTGLGVEPRADGGTTPMWDGADRWLLDPTVLQPASDGGAGHEPKYSDPQAYVSGGVLVMHLAQGSGPNALTRSSMAVEDFVLAARLVQDGDRWSLRDGVNGSRMKLTDALATMGRAPNPFQQSPQAVCANSVAYHFFKQAICSAADIASSGAEAGAPCDALSLGAAFEAEQALLGDVGPAPAPPPACAPDISPETDSCATP